jgi:hypothetical protein
VTFAAEIGDVRRFDNPRQLMGFLGLVPRERSTGDTVRRAGLTLAGNRRAQRVLADPRDDPRLVLARPRPPTANTGDHLKPADADNPVRFECRVEITHKSISQSREIIAAGAAAQNVRSAHRLRTTR